jgi:hypothetical protein
MTNHPEVHGGPTIIVRFTDPTTGESLRGTLMNPARIEGTNAVVEGIEHIENVAIVCEDVDTLEFVMFSVPVANVERLVAA